MNRERSVERLRGELLCLLRGETTYLESSRVVSRLRFELDAEDDPDFLNFMLIDSETDHLPVGAQRQYWSEEALARKEPEMQRAEEWARAIAEASVKTLLARFCAYAR